MSFSTSKLFVNYNKRTLLWDHLKCSQFCNSGSRAVFWAGVVSTHYFVFSTWNLASVSSSLSVCEARVDCIWCPYYGVSSCPSTLWEIHVGGQSKVLQAWRARRARLVHRAGARRVPNSQSLICWERDAGRKSFSVGLRDPSQAPSLVVYY